MMAILVGVVVFVAAAALDYAYVRYQLLVAAGRAHTAGVFSVALYLIGIVGSLAVLEHSHWYIVPECLGLYVGTVVAVRRAQPLAR